MTSEIETLIAERVASATRRGGFTAQDYAHLKGYLSPKRRPGLAEAACELIRRHGPGSELHFPMQEVAARLLVDFKPPLSLSLDAALAAVIDSWNPSVEQFPIYLAQIFGVEVVRAKLSELERAPLSPRARQSAQTMAWWLGANR